MSLVPTRKASVPSLKALSRRAVTKGLVVTCTFDVPRIIRHNREEYGADLAIVRGSVVSYFDRGQLVLECPLRQSRIRF